MQFGISSTEVKTVAEFLLQHSLLDDNQNTKKVINKLLRHGRAFIGKNYAKYEGNDRRAR